ncbi:hypothetical protein IFM89_022886 [Coptis chinensis]|uniref:Replication protein A 70 kDa DNA-binding subunit B/D first OB fold domain-containing protein n=1 Tax=Coptis chinensis TaxID=261450 RepID=A0A835H687_9MAGN|nr:hypothetical protein IFM89_022886 [Coptis chinensis]
MGTEEYVRLSKLTDRTHRCKVNVRVSRRWTLGSKDSQEKKKRFNVVLIDEQGNQIQVIVPKNHSNTFLNVLHEGHVYHIENFSVQTRTDSYFPIQLEYLILIRWDIIVRGSSKAHPEIPKYKFDFIEFNKIRLLPKGNQNLQDVYGTLEGVSELIYQLKARTRDDTESTLITIFGDEAEELLKHPAYELEKLIESENGIQTVKAIIDEIIGTSIVFEIKISQYNIQSQGSPTLICMQNAKYCFGDDTLPDGFSLKKCDLVSFEMITPGYLLLSDINDQNQHCRIKFCVSRKWSIEKELEGKTSRFDMVLIDNKVSQFHLNCINSLAIVINENNY